MAPLGSRRTFVISYYGRQFMFGLVSVLLEIRGSGIYLIVYDLVPAVRG